MADEEVRNGAWQLREVSPFKHMGALTYTLSITQIARIAANIMVRLDEQDKRRIYVIRKTADDIKLGSWADCETIYNFLSEESRSQDALSAIYRQLDKAKMSRATSTPEWNATRVQVRQWLYNVRLLRY